ncbi:MAG: histidinol-phosphate transaminase [Kiritimatiellales bacterium]
MKTNKWISSVPVYEPGKPIDEVARELGFDDISEIIKVASNENELGPSPKALKAMAGIAPEMHRYPDGGCFALKRKLAEQLGVKPQNLLFGNGSNELIEFLGHALLGAETNLVMSEGAFAVYRLVAALFNAQAIAVPMKKFAHDLDAMLAAITPKTRMVIVCNPNNPTGTIVSPAKIRNFLKKLPQDVLAVFDEAYLEYMPDDKKPDLVKEILKGRKNVIVLRTFSKIYGLAGLRIGYAVGGEEIIGLLSRVRQPFNVNAMAEAAALAALDDTKHLEKSRKTNFQGLELFAQKLPTIGKGLKFVPSFANFILVKTGNGREVFKELQKRKVIVRPMDGYGLPDWIRITVGKPAQNRAVLKALKEVL